MRRIIAALVVVLLLASAGSAEARRRRYYGGGPGGFGIGLVLGEPTGLTAEFRFGPRTSLDLALGLDSLDDDGFYLRFDYLVRLVNLSSGGSVSVPLYLGIGAFVFDHERHGDDFHLGPRVPFGIAVDLHGAPVEFFFELAVRFILVTDHDHDHDRADLTGALGFRIYF